MGFLSGMKRAASPEKDADIEPDRKKAISEMAMTMTQLHRDNSSKDLRCSEYGTMTAIEQDYGVECTDRKNFTLANTELERIIFQYFPQCDFEFQQMFMAASNVLGRVILHKEAIQDSPISGLASACFLVVAKFYLEKQPNVSDLGKLVDCEARMITETEFKILQVTEFDIHRCTTIDVLYSIFNFHVKENRERALQIIDRAGWFTVVMQRACGSRFIDCPKTMAVGALMVAEKEFMDTLFHEEGMATDMQPQIKIFDIPDSEHGKLFTLQATKAANDIVAYMNFQPSDFDKLHFLVPSPSFYSDEQSQRSTPVM
tara:strand:+ start:26288 stop:27232 length:945 start_codon:yes stop_codon:yes gene_type:complete